MLEQLRKALAELHEKRSTAVEAMEASAAVATAEERSLTAEEDGAFVEARGVVQGIDAEIDSLEERIAPLAEIEERTKKISQEVPFQANNGITRQDPYKAEVRNDSTKGELRGLVERAFEVERSIDAELTESTFDKIEAVDTGERSDMARHILATGRPEYRSAYAKLMSGMTAELTADEQRAVQEVRTSSLTNADGGYAIPYVIDPTIIDTRVGSVNPMRNLATVKSIPTNKWTGVSSAGVTASWDAEAAVVSDDSPTLADPSITAHKGQVFVPYTTEIGEDWAGMEQDIRVMFANARDDLEAVGHITGSGSGQPKGIVTALAGTASEVDPAVAETFSEVDLYALEDALADRYLTRAQFIANKSIYNLVRQFANSDGPDLLVRLGAGLPQELIGYSINKASAMDGAFDASATADNHILALGDFSYYYIVDRIGMTTEMIPHLFDPTTGRPTGKRGIISHWRTGADCVNIDAMRILNVATAA